MKKVQMEHFLQTPDQEPLLWQNFLFFCLLRWLFGWCKAQENPLFIFLPAKVEIQKEVVHPKKNKHLPLFSDPSMWHWCSMSRTSSLSPICLLPANTKTVVFGCVWSILATSHLSFTSLPVCSFLWTTLIFPVNGQICDSPTYTKDSLPNNYAHKDEDSWIAIDVFSQWMTLTLSWILTAELILE